MSEPNGSSERYWSMRTEDLLRSVGSSSEDGLSSTEASSRIDSYGYNELKEQESVSRLLVIANQLRSPLLSILVFAAIVSGFAREWTDSIIILTILSGSVAIGYSREYRAQAAAEKLRSRLVTKVLVLRDKVETRVDLREIVPGDIVLLSAGNLIPADARLLETKDFFVNEAVLTGESFPVEKKTAILPEATPLSQRSNCVFLGASVRSGTARCLIVRTATRTEFGSIAHRLTLQPPEQTSIVGSDDLVTC